MSNNIEINGFYSGRPTVRLQFYMQRLEVDTAGNRSRYGWQLNAYPNGNREASLAQYIWSISIGSYTQNGTHDLDFRSGNAVQLAKGETSWISHASDGTLPLNLDAYHGPAGVFGLADAPATTWETDPIPRLPGAPTPIGLDQPTSSSLRYRFTPGNGNGSSIIENQIAYGRNPTLESAETHFSGPVSTAATAPNLVSSSTYYFWSRTRNSVGWGPWSSRVNGNTLASGQPTLSVAPNVSGTAAVVSMGPPLGSVAPIELFEIQRRTSGTTTPVFSSTALSSPYTIVGLMPGTGYEWRVRARIGGYYTDWTAWTFVVQPSPSTNAGDYFDGSSAPKDDVFYDWLGTTPGVGVSRERGYRPNGVMRFEQGNAASGGTGVTIQATGYLSPKMASVRFLSDTVNPGFITGVYGSIEADSMFPGQLYWGSLHVQLQGARRLMQIGIKWSSPGGTDYHEEFDWGDVSLIEGNGPWVRLIHSAVMPDWAVAGVPVIRDYAGTSEDGYGHGPYGHGPYGNGSGLDIPWVPFKAGERLNIDQMMMSLTSLYPYFSGMTPDTPYYNYEWLGVPHNSISVRYTLSPGEVDPLIDPDCPPPPDAPRPPVIVDDCIDEVGSWRRYWVVVDAIDVSTWLDVVPTIRITSGASEARQVRVRYFPNPLLLEPAALDPASWEYEQIIGFMPANTVLTIDGVSERVWASVAGGDARAADKLLYGTGGLPTTWPVLSCGRAYVISIDVPLDAPVGNISVEVDLTQRMS